jgi:hypothetical protein
MDLRRAAVSLRKQLQERNPNLDVHIKSGSPGQLTVEANGNQVYDYKKEGEKSTSELANLVLQQVGG